ncbi:MAG: GlsB/YeaQ/YmgE family stress response membrane protein [Thermomicrobiales bacterium]
MSILFFIFVGIVAGWLAGVVTRTDRSIWGDLILGLAGALVAGLITDGLAGGDSGLIAAIVVATLAAIVLVLIKNMLFGDKKLAQD